ncbi:MAG: hypothetical protein DMG03_13540 [Acidobacteria bacterium]|nr:MAG: hypothetical protein DMG03_13540 [Acidobacteriota bacterium]
MDVLSDEQLIAQYRLAPAAERSRPLVEELFRRHQSRVVAWCYRLTGDRTQAADLAQEVFEVHDVALRHHAQSLARRAAGAAGASA